MVDIVYVVDIVLYVVDIVFYMVDIVLYMVDIVFYVVARVYWVVIRYAALAVHLILSSCLHVFDSTLRPSVFLKHIDLSHKCHHHSFLVHNCNVNPNHLKCDINIHFEKFWTQGCWRCPLKSRHKMTTDRISRNPYSLNIKYHKV